eukprot:TRINITY_DN7812_c0_g1_i1.p1 TRINITY_DN7812_c0_g1~~TRINITY_DN7812_c0_g1_i1.p1  ORF type:complete len:234 (-),score=40.52 TRINITY_DN7812_c0_g1_i1:82-783(-)
MEEADAFLTQEFEEASRFLSKNSNLSLDNEQKLQFYGLYKQATVGPCNTSRPAFWDMTGKAKWDAWKSVEALTKEDSMRTYIETLTSIFPGWIINEEIPESMRSVGETETGFAVSRPVVEQDNIPESEKGLPYWTSMGDVEKVRAFLQKEPGSINQKDVEGRAALHYACDRGSLQLTQILIENGADINLQDEEGMTPAHYAGVIEAKEIWDFLIEKGADLHIRDNDGNPPHLG